MRSKLRVAAILGLAILVRIPFLRLGFGLDEDSCLVAGAASKMLETGSYEISRYPGNPLHEILTAAILAVDGSTLSNVATMLAFMASALVFLAIARRVEAKHPLWLLFIYCFLPILFVASTVTMDYVWALLCILVAYLLLLKERSMWSAIALGVAVGFRLGSAVLLAPMLLYLWSTRRRHLILRYSLVAAVTGVIAFSPPLISRGLRVLSYYLSSRHELSHIPYFAAYTVGLPVSVLLFFGSLACLPTLIRELRERVSVVWSCVGAILVILALFVRIPLESEYLIPAIPFLLLLIDRYASRVFLAAFTVLSLLFGVVSLELKDSSDLDTIRLNPHLEAGIVLEDLEARHDQILIREQLAPALRDLLGSKTPTAVVTGFIVGCAHLRENPELIKAHLPELQHRSGIYDVLESQILLVNGPIREDQYVQLRAQGYEIAFIEGSLRYSQLDSAFELAGRPGRFVSVEELYTAARRQAALVDD